MARWHLHPDGVVIVEGPAGIYIDTPVNFAADFGRAVPALPAGMVERLYDPAGRHFVADAKGNAYPVEPVTFAFGDAAIAALPDLLASKAAREA